MTPWILWFLQTLKLALEAAFAKTEGVLRKSRFWDAHRTVSINERQRKVLNMLFDGFEGKLNSSKWYMINHCSQDTVNRDIKDLITKGILRPTGEGGRSTNYELFFFLIKRYVRNLCFGKSTIYKQIKNLKLVSKLADIQVFLLTLHSKPSFRKRRFRK